MTLCTLQSSNLAAGASLSLETSSLAGGALRLAAFNPPLRHLPLTSAKSDAGVALTATATGGAMGVSRTAGTSLQLVGEATSSSAKTDKAMWEFVLPDTYNAGAAVGVTANAAISGSGTLTAASCTLALNVYSEVNGVETALTVSPAAASPQQITAAGADINWSITAGNSLAVGARLVAELTMVITSSSGANTGEINAMKFQA